MSPFAILSRSRIEVGAGRAVPRRGPSRDALELHLEIELPAVGCRMLREQLEALIAVGSIPLRQLCRFRARSKQK